MTEPAKNPENAAKIFIWDDFAAYLGPSFSTDRHSHFYTQICFGVKSPIRLRGRSGVWRTYDVAFIPSGLSHQTEVAADNFCILLLNPIALRLDMFISNALDTNEPAVDIGNYLSRDDLDQVLKAVSMSNKGAREVIFTLLGRYNDRDARQPKDARIVRSIFSMLDNPEHISLPAIAGAVGLSASRFRHLFRDETGITFSGYRLWLKTQRAIARLSHHPDLARAALEGGFADQAHFSRIFRQSFGMRPSQFAKTNFRPVFFTK